MMLSDFNPSWRGLILGAACLLLALVVTGARARAECSTDGAQYSTDFSDKDASWGSTPHIAIGGGQLAIAEPAGGTDSAFYTLDTFSAGTICADFKLVGASDKGAAAGIAFWGSSAQTYYSFVVDPISGTFAVQRRLGGKLSTALAWQGAPSIATGPDAINELAVDFSDNHAAFYVNDKEVDELTGFAPNAASSIGVRGDGGTALGAVWSITNLVVRT